MSNFNNLKTEHYQAEDDVPTNFFALPTDVGAPVVDKAPEDNTYDTLKSALISHFIEEC